MAGASLSRTEARALCRLRFRDTSTVNPGITDANLNLLIEEARQFYSALYPDQIARELGTYNTIAHASSLQITVSNDNVLPREITSAYLVDAAPTPDLFTPLRFADSLESMLAKQVDDNIEAAPKEVIALRALGSDAVFDIYFYPIPDAVYQISLWGSFEPTLMTADTDKLLFGFHGSRTIVKIAAATAAAIIGRPPEFVQGILAELPDRVATRMREDLGYRRPLKHQDKAKT